MSPQLPLLMRVAELRGQAPSELLGITCDYCSYCLDEAALIVDAQARAANYEEMEREAEQDAASRDLRREMGIA